MVCQWGADCEHAELLRENVVKEDANALPQLIGDAAAVHEVSDGVHLLLPPPHYAGEPERLLPLATPCHVATHTLALLTRPTSVLAHLPFELAQDVFL